MSTAVHPAFRCWWALATAALIAGTLCCQGGCVATKYKLAKANTPPIQSLNIAFPPSGQLQPMLAALVSYGGPGSWKREALWDEYVVNLENHGERALTVDSATLAASSGTTYAAGSDPWALEKQSKKLEKQYRGRGEAFMRAAGPGVLIVGVGAATIGSVAGAGVGAAAIPAAATVAAVTVVALPVYYVAVWGINHHNKKAVMAEFARRRLPLPLTLAPGETRTVSAFFPMVRSPSSLELHWLSRPTSGQAALPLDFLKGLHVPSALADPPTKELAP